jgi:GTP pyrophosphokinase
MVSVVNPLLDYVPLFSRSSETLDFLLKKTSIQQHENIRKAFAFASTHYINQQHPKTGEPLLDHVLSVAIMMADLELHPDVLLASLMIGAAFCQLKESDLVLAGFSHEAIQLAQGYHKILALSQLKQNDQTNLLHQAQQAEILRKMLLAMASDIRVVLLSLASQTQTMHYLSNVTDENLCVAIAEETLSLFAPLANRLGVWQMKWALEDLGFKHTKPLLYKKIAKLLDEKRNDRLQYIDQILIHLRQQLQLEGIAADVAGRPKHIYSIYKKMLKKNLEFTDLYDIRAVRILVDKEADCYRVLGIIHALWQPISGEFDDYISYPKANNYRSLHTVVVGPEDKALEVQIRTFEMHQSAESGIAAHWRYKEGGSSNAAYEEKIAWLRQILDWKDTLIDQDDFKGMSNHFKMEMFSDTLYVLTPGGRVISLPTGATPIDFAYAVHTDLGHRCRGAKIEGKIVPLSTPLQSGQRIEILTSKTLKPSVNWLHDGWVKTSKAIGKIRQFIRLQNNETIKENGRLLFEKTVSKDRRVTRSSVLEKLAYDHLDELYQALGQGELTVRQLQSAMHQCIPQSVTITPEAKLVKKSQQQHKSSQQLSVCHQEGLLTVLAKCCKPAPPDLIEGFITKGRGVSIHRIHCIDFIHLKQNNPGRCIEVQWPNTTDNYAFFEIDVQIIAQQNPLLLSHLSDLFSREKIKLAQMNLKNKQQLTIIDLSFELKDTDFLLKLFEKIKSLDDVISINRR